MRTVIVGWECHGKEIDIEDGRKTNTCEGEEASRTVKEQTCSNTTSRWRVEAAQSRLCDEVFKCVSALH